MSNTINILVSEELKSILKEIETESMVASLFLKGEHSKEDLVDNPVNYISISSQDKTKISYLTSDRMKTINPDIYWTSPSRFQAKPGAFISKVFKNIPSKEVEKFSNLFRSQALKPAFNFEIVGGQSIKEYYHYQSYSRNEGTLGASCMKHDGCQPFLNIYVDNKDIVSMLVMLDDEKRLMGRALLWNFDSYKIMDRIYTTCDENLLFYFKQWATRNGYLFKSEQNWYNTLFFEQIGSKRQELRMEIKLKNGQFRQYPYMDTFKFLDTKTGFLYNYIPEDDSSIKTLCGSDGSRYEYDYLRLDGLDKMFRHRGDCVYLDYLQFYTSCNNSQWSEVNDQYILNKDCKYDELINDYLFIGDYESLNRVDAIERRRKAIEERNEKMKKSSKMSIDISRYMSAIDGSAFGLSTERLSQIISDYSNYGDVGITSEYRGGDEISLELGESPSEMEADIEVSPDSPMNEPVPQQEI